MAGCSMPIISKREREFLADPSKFSKDYQRVMQHRLLKKLKEIVCIYGELLRFAYDVQKRKAEKKWRSRKKAKIRKMTRKQTAEFVKKQIEGEGHREWSPARIVHIIYQKPK